MAKAATNRTPRNLPATPAPQVVPEAQTQQGVITAAVMAAYDEFVTPTITTATLREDVGKALNAEHGVRAKLAIRLAGLAITGNWGEDNIVDAVKAASEKWAKGRNAVPTTLAQFSVELKRAMHPKAREHVETAFTLARNAFAAERKAADAEIAKDPKAKPDMPLNKMFSRAYQCAIGSKGMLAAHISDMPEAVDPHMLAEARSFDERTDTSKAARRFDKIMAQLKELHDEFPARELATILSYAGKINKKALDAARRRSGGAPAITRSTSRNPAPPPASDAQDAGEAMDSLLPQE